MPLFETRDDRPSAVLQREASGPSQAASRISRGLILVQMAGCTLLVISTGLLLQSFRASLETAAGRHLGNPVLVTLETLPASKSATLIEGRKYFDDAVMAALSVGPVTERRVGSPIARRPSGVAVGSIRSATVQRIAT